MRVWPSEVPSHTVNFGAHACPTQPGRHRVAEPSVPVEEKVPDVGLSPLVAFGRPLVGSPTRSLQDFGHVTELPSGSEEWSAALATAPVPPVASHAATAARREIARLYDWSEIIYLLACTLSARLGPGYLDRLKPALAGKLPEAASAT